MTTILAAKASTSSVAALGEAIDTIDQLIKANQKELTDARTSNPSGENPIVYNTLDERLEAIESNLNVSSGGLTGRVDAIAASLGQASDDTTNPVTPASGLYAKVEALEAEVNDAHRILDNGVDSLDNRFDDIESAISHEMGKNGNSDKGGLVE